MSTPDPSDHPAVNPASPEPERRYSLVRVGSAVYAFSDYDRFVRGLRHLWDSQLVPETLPSATGAELRDIANLRVVDPELDDLPDAAG
jgi:hypothetical protein